MLRGRCTAILAASTVGCFTQPNIDSRVTVHNIRRVRLGMAREEVQAILGVTHNVESEDPEYYGVDAETMVYFRWLPHPLQYPMLWVHLKSGRAAEVYAKRHNVFDSDGVHDLSDRSHWEARDFESTFP